MTLNTKIPYQIKYDASKKGLIAVGEQTVEVTNHVSIHL